MNTRNRERPFISADPKFARCSSIKSDFPGARCGEGKIACGKSFINYPMQTSIFHFTIRVVSMVIIAKKWHKQLEPPEKEIKTGLLISRILSDWLQTLGKCNACYENANQMVDESRAPEMESQPNLCRKPWRLARLNDAVFFASRGVEMPHKFLKTRKVKFSFLFKTLFARFVF